jgi:hypothetical protein
MNKNPVSVLYWHEDAVYFDDGVSSATVGAVFLSTHNNKPMEENSL